MTNILNTQERRQRLVNEKERLLMELDVTKVKVTSLKASITRCEELLDRLECEEED